MFKDVYIGEECYRYTMRTYDNLPKRYRELAYYIDDYALRLFKLYGANRTEEA